MSAPQPLGSQVKVHRLPHRYDYGDYNRLFAIRLNGVRAGQIELDVWFEVDRDADARGLPGVYQALAEPCWQAISRGQTPGLRWKPGTEPSLSTSDPSGPQ